MEDGGFNISGYGSETKVDVICKSRFCFRHRNLKD